MVSRRFFTHAEIKAMRSFVREEIQAEADPHFGNLYPGVDVVESRLRTYLEYCSELPFPKDEG